MSATYGNGFTLDFAYCKNCRFSRDRTKADHNQSEFKLKEDIALVVEKEHDEFWRGRLLTACRKRELVISYNRVMVENV